MATTTAGQQPTLLHLEVTSKAFQVVESKDKAAGLNIKGFASIEGIDRDGDNVPPTAFDVDSFLKNGQLWFNHQLFRRSMDGMGVPVGRVEDMHVVRVELTPGDSFKVIDLKTEQLVDSGLDQKEFSVKNGDKGLWVRAVILEPEVIKLVEDGRINAFSWSGQLVRNPNGAIKKIDLREVSVVFLPANAKALFMIGKSTDFAKQQDYLITQGGNVFELEKNAPLKNSTVGAAYAFMAVSANGPVAVHSIDGITEKDAALQHARNIAKDMQRVVVFSNQWKADENDHQVYRAVDCVEGDVSLVMPEEKVLPTQKSKLWSKEYVDSLPDGCFAYIIPDTPKDSEQKSLRKNRFFPYKNHAGDYDQEAIKAAIDEARMSAYAHPALTVLLPAAKEAGLEEFLNAEKNAPLTVEEAMILGIEGEVTIERKKGGDDVDEVLKKLGELAESVKGIGDRLSAVEKKADEEGTANPAADATTNAATKAAEEKAEEQGTPATDKTAETKPEENTAAKTEEPPKEDVGAQVLDALKGLTDSMTSIDNRLKKLESAPAKSKQVEEENATENASKSAEVLAQAFAAMDPNVRTAVQKAAKKNAVGNLLFSEAIKNHAVINSR